MVFIEKDKWELRGTENRRLSWRECAKIQTLPDQIEIDGRLLDKYRVVGNSVPPDIAYKISKPAIDQLRQLL
jgi:DNA (cytosine-5)-methyltransferase 1